MSHSLPLVVLCRTLVRSLSFGASTCPLVSTLACHATIFSASNLWHHTSGHISSSRLQTVCYSRTFSKRHFSPLSDCPASWQRTWPFFFLLVNQRPQLLFTWFIQTFGILLLYSLWEVFLNMYALVMIILVLLRPLMHQDISHIYANFVTIVHTHFNGPIKVFC